MRKGAPVGAAAKHPASITIQRGSRILSGLTSCPKGQIDQTKQTTEEDLSAYHIIMLLKRRE